MKSVFRGCVGALFVGVTIVGCGQNQQTLTTESNGKSSTVAVDGSKYLLNTEPEEVRGVREVRETAKDQDDVVIVGRIGGSPKPWLEGLAAFTIVDPAMKHCHELGDDGCSKPWDYC